MTFTPTQFHSAADKEKFFKHFQRFVKSNYNVNLFHKWFYVQLSFMFYHIAHYNKHGFYETWFADELSIERFWDRVKTHPCHGDPAYTYCDVEHAIQKWQFPDYDSNRDPWAHRGRFENA